MKFIFLGLRQFSVEISFSISFSNDASTVVFAFSIGGKGVVLFTPARFVAGFRDFWTTVAF